MILVKPLCFDRSPERWKWRTSKGHRRSPTITLTEEDLATFLQVKSRFESMLARSLSNEEAIIEMVRFALEEMKRQDKYTVRKPIPTGNRNSTQPREYVTIHVEIARSSEPLSATRRAACERAMAQLAVVLSEYQT